MPDSVKCLFKVDVYSMAYVASLYYLESKNILYSSTSNVGLVKLEKRIVFAAWMDIYL